jgi:hypothetical protein
MIFVYMLWLLPSTEEWVERWAAELAEWAVLVQQ